MPPKSGDVTSSGLFVTKTRFRFAFHEDGGGEVSQVTAKPGLVTGMDPGGLEGGLATSEPYMQRSGNKMYIYIYI